MNKNSFWKNKKVLITGHTGFKGTWLLIWLIELGCEVTGISLPPNNSSKLFINVQPKIKNRYKNNIPMTIIAPNSSDITEII